MTSPDTPMSSPGGDSPEDGVPQIFLVLPAYNEEESLPSLLARVQQFQKRTQAPLRVVLVDDGSTDQTVAVARGWLQKLPLTLVRHQRNQGLGTTICDGLVKASELSHGNDIIVTMDADNTQPPELIEQMIEKVDQGHDLVIASRYQPGSGVRGLSWLRRIFSRGASLLFRMLLPISGARDYTCGFRAYRAELVHKILQAAGERARSRKGFECMADLLLTAGEQGASVAEVPLVLRYDHKGGSSKMRVLPTAWNTLMLLVGWWLRRRRHEVTRSSLPKTPQ